MNSSVRILCRLPKFNDITDLSMNLHWLPIRPQILFKVQVLTYQAYLLYNNARDLRSNHTFLIKPGQSVARI